ncbi:hypothetical protein BGX29_012261 [Mortierella sp. GBA35]|nr:hypothetical protein BGX29_012261 [Mortierella sp. GBA35]
MLKSSKPSPLPIALTIPEILECIFSFLSSRRRSTVVQKVCRQWYAVCRRMADLPPATWDSSLIEPLDSKFVHSLTTAQVFHLFSKVSHSQYEIESKDERWRKLLNVIDNLQSEGKIQLQQVLVGNELASISFIYLEPLLPVLNRCSTSVSVLRLEIKERPDRFLFHLILRELGAVETVVDACPVLRQLTVYQAYPAQFTKKDGVQFIRQVASSCTLLKTFHLSIQDSSWTTADMAVFLDYQPPGLTGWSFPDKDVEMNLPSMTLSPSIQTRPPQTPLCRILQSTDPLLLMNHHQRLTRLELTRTPRNNGRDPVPDVQCAGAMHQFLCNAPCLQHLLAPNVVIEIENLDINNLLQQARLGQNIMKPRPRDPQDTLPLLWACRRLRTLHITFDYDQGIVYHKSDQGSANGKSLGPFDSLIVFGYLSRCCPNLTDLQMRRWSTNVAMEAGFCLLSRLEQLERLVLTGRHFNSFTKQDLGWIMGEPQDTSTKWSSGLSTLSGTFSVRRLSPPPASRSANGSYVAGQDLNLNTLGLIDDVHEWARETKTQSGGGAEQTVLRCWPALEFIHLR